jgi:hypothetical protein
MSKENREEPMLKLKAVLVGVSTMLILMVATYVPVASAAKRFDSRVTIHISPGGSAAYFYGLVTSEKGACTKNRAMKVLVSPDGQSAFSTYATGIHTNIDGTWTLDKGPGAIGNGFYKAVAQSKDIDSGTCRRATSKTFFVD